MSTRVCIGVCVVPPVHALVEDLGVLEDDGVGLQDAQACGGDGSSSSIRCRVQVTMAAAAVAAVVAVIAARWVA